MSEPFGEYSFFYDEIYKDKDYEAECDYLEGLFEQYSLNRPSSLVDLGCGTGGHALLLAKRGYKITGVDLSEGMLRVAREKAVQENISIDFLRADIRKMDLHRSFDAAICMFAVMGYQTSNEDLLDAFGAVRRHLKIGGTFIFDCWHGPAVLKERPTERLKEFERSTHKVYRFARPVLDVTTNCVEVHYKLISVEKSTSMSSEFEEKHRMRYLFVQEVELLARLKGFSTAGVYPFMSMKKGVSDRDWNVTFVLSAV